MNDIKAIRVDLGRRSYEIRIGIGILPSFGRALKDTLGVRRAAVISNDMVWDLHGERLAAGLEEQNISFIKIIVPDGEEAKSLPVAEEVYGELITAGFERGEPVVAFGGGVVGDLGGFVAGTYLRGVPLVHVPTTLLAQIDSSIGGKAAINHPKGKNLVGLFYQPVLVFSDVSVLKTLHTRELRNGLAEAIKYGFIREEGLLDYIEENLERILAVEPDAVRHLVKECAGIKARVVEIDERDKGMRAILNYGHTFGHAVETRSGYSYSHGEAVAVGMLFAAELSLRLGMIDESVVWRHRALIERAGLPSVAEDVDAPSIMRGLAVDKKRESGENLFVLLEAVGKPVVRPVPRSVLERLIGEFVARR